MKFNTVTSFFAATAAATLASAATSASAVEDANVMLNADDHNDNINIDVDALIKKGLLLQPGHSIALNSRSDECKAETLALSEDDGVVAAMDAMTNACPPTSNNGAVISRTGATDCPSVGEVQRACTAAGGKFESVPFVGMSCSNVLFGGSANIRMYDVPDCIGQSCDEAILNTAEGKEELATLFGNGLGMGYSCYVSGYDPEAQGSSSGFVSLAYPTIYLMVTLGASLFFF